MHVLHLPHGHLLRTALLAAGLTLAIVLGILAFAPTDGGTPAPAAAPSPAPSAAELPGTGAWLTDPLAPPALLAGHR